ncbi:hypothetical protein BN1723_019574 [Verticillium longisporum]|uniref:Uncharacterized protein n=1 Tax=Verticillium longisporum TaxID=100787 RepID=A0A0G4NEL5_VERLO|nr:hypothetical protein BN1723_019574 [Verticillium longisporum]
MPMAGPSSRSRPLGSGTLLALWASLLYPSLIRGSLPTRRSQIGSRTPSRPSPSTSRDLPFDLPSGSASAKTAPI